MKEERPFYEDDAVNLIRQKMGEASPNWVRKIMRKMKLQRITRVSIERMIACLAIHNFGLPITTRLLATVFDREEEAGMATFLHTLGDKGCLLMKRGVGGRRYEWIVSPVFWRYFTEGWEEEQQSKLKWEI